MESVVMDRYNSYSVYHRGVVMFNSSKQPPLLPLPCLSPRKMVGGFRPRWKKPRPCGGNSPKKEAKASVSVNGGREEKEKEEEEEEEKVVWLGSLYSVAPPPSSVPMPSFTVARGREGGGRGGGGGVDAWATGELRRLLGL